ncbi:hypothetical protein [Photobacterium leiognathi]|uniref:hypothetical protein n=1 Tax=Photobacterium leiognathi TaxID=553611 RepID=UPI002981C694|nr:hypothetical protein [Photobacterium leiognathi]
MMHTYGITSEDVKRNNRFDITLFKQAVIDAVPVGTKLEPTKLTRLALSLGAKAKKDDLAKKLKAAFMNNNNSQLVRRRSDQGNGYVYEKVSN